MNVSTTMKHVKMRISGKVQGVFFRASAKAEAERLGLTGFIRNEGDGSVYVEIEGSEAAVERFMVWCKRGPQLAEVESVQTEEGQPKHFTTFEISPRV